MKKPFFSVLLSCVFCLQLFSTVELNTENIYNHPEFWPVRVQSTVPIESKVSGRSINTKLPAIFIRIENDRKTVLMDFGSEGLIELPVEKTDVVERATRVQSGEEFKTMPNMMFTLLNKCVIPRENGLTKRLSPSDFADKDFILFIYIDGEKDSWKTLHKQFKPHAHMVKESSVMPVLMPQIDINETTKIKDMVDAGIYLPFMFGYLIPPYTDSFKHGYEDGMLLVMTDGNGKIIQTGSNVADFTIPAIPEAVEETAE